MGTFSIWHWLIVLVVVLVLFGGRGKISQLMGDFGKGLKSFRKSLREDEPFEEEKAAPTVDARVLPPQPAKAGETVDAERDRVARP